MQNSRLISAAAVTAVAAIALTGCNADDTVNSVKDKAKEQGSALASKHGDKAKDLASKGIDKAKGAASKAMGGDDSASASPASGSFTPDLGDFGDDANAKAVGQYFTARQSGDTAGLKSVSKGQALKQGTKYIKRTAGKSPAFELTVVGVKGAKVQSCVGPKGTTPRVLVVKGGKVAKNVKGTQSCA